MEVNFDPAKNEANLQKHGLSLQQAENFDFDNAYYDVDNTQDYGEVRYNAIGWLDTLLHALTFTQEGEAIRAISLRKASRREQAAYAEET